MTNNGMGAAQEARNYSLRAPLSRLYPKFARFHFNPHVGSEDERTSARSPS